MDRINFSLFTDRRFWPLFLTQALGALNDNIFRNALVLLILYRISEQIDANGQILVTVAAAIFIAPFFLFSALAGQIADKFEKSGLIRWIKLSEVVIMAAGAAALWANDLYMLMGVLFLMGAQSAFFGPVKYSILPDHLHKEELIAGNGFIEAGTFLAILIGTIAGGLLILQDHGVTVVSITVLSVAVLGLGTSFMIPKAPPSAPGLTLNRNFLAETGHILRRTRRHRDLFLSILGISWFWLIGATFLSQFPAMAKDSLNADETVVTLFLATFSIGIGIGSILCNRFLNGEITAKYVPLGAIGISLFTGDLFLAIDGYAVTTDALVPWSVFLQQARNIRIIGDLLGIALCSGLFIVPLYTILQSRSDAVERSQMIAGNNIMNALFMVIGALATAVMLALGFSVPDVFLSLAIVNSVVAVYICVLLPDTLVKAFLRLILKLVYRVQVTGIEHYAKAGKRAVIVLNHVSFLDALLVAVYLPVKPLFAINTQIAAKWWVKPFLSLVDAFPLDPTNPMGTKSLIKEVQKDKHCVIFPEGRITVTGALMKVYEGPGMVADKAEAMIVPVRIDGAQYTPFSRIKDKVRVRWFPKITLTILPPRRFDIDPSIVGRARRKVAGNKLYDVMSAMVFETCDRRQTLFSALLDAKDIHGNGHVIVEDIAREPMHYGRLTTASLILGRKLQRITARGEYVGVLLPNSMGTAVIFFALQAFGRVPAMLNFSTGAKNIISAIHTAQVKTVLTSRKFIKLAKLEKLICEVSHEAKVVYLEDIKDEVSVLDKLVGVAFRPFARNLHKKYQGDPDEAAVVLFTSGSEGVPKGVVLSHENLLANRYQLAARIDFNPTDSVFNALPMFHSFGLTGGTLLPIFSGVKTFLYPSPLHYRIVPALVYDTDATILFGTDTFLTGYARVAHAYDFYSLRYVFAGAEKVKEETRRTWSDKFGIRILEGYGATETAPVIAANVPMHFKAGTVGRLLPGINYHLVPVPGIEEGGRLVVTGPNVMVGYLRANNPGVVELAQNSTYDTGDIVTVDQEGFVTIQGRAKRFAKIAGEMVSLTAVESYASAVWPNHGHAVVSIPDTRKGEQLVLLTDNDMAAREEMLAFARDEGIPELMIPKEIRFVERIPVLGTGKVDYVAVSQVVAQFFDQKGGARPLAAHELISDYIASKSFKKGNPNSVKGIER